MPRFKSRQPARKLAYRKRHLALSSHDQVRLKRYKRIICFLIIKKQKEGKLSEDAVRFLGVVASAYAQISTVSEEDYEKASELRPSKERDIDSFKASDCRINFRFLQHHLHELVTLLGFPRVIRFKNRRRMSNEEVFLRGLYELVSGENQE